MKKYTIQSIAVLFIISFSLIAQEKDEKWDVNQPVEPFREVTIETEEEAIANCGQFS